MKVHGISSSASFGFTDLPWKDLGLRGFQLGELIQSPDTGTSTGLIGMTGSGFLQQLKFINIQDEDLFQKNQQEFAISNKPLTRKSSHDDLTPVLNLWTETGIESAISDQEIKVCFQKKQYDHSEFPNPTTHPNSVYKIGGILWGLTPEKADQVSVQLGFPPKLDSIDMTDGSSMIFLSPLDEAFRYFEIKKEFPLWAVILVCRDLHQFNKMAQPDKFLTIKGQQAALLSQYPTSWDILVVQG